MKPIFIVLAAVVALGTTVWLGLRARDRSKSLETAARVARPPRPLRAVPALEISADLQSSPVYAGDPFSVRVRIASPRARQEQYRRQLKLERGETAEPAGFTAPKIARDWVSSLQMDLYRLDAAGTRTSVLSGSNWDAYLVKPDPRLADIGPVLGVESRDWLVPPESLRFEEGHYVLELSWLGKGKVDNAFLAADGALKGRDLRFHVHRPVEPAQRAAHLTRLARYEYNARQYWQARADARSALALSPKKLDPEATMSYFVVANASLALQDVPSAKAAYEELVAQFPAGSSHDLVLVARRGLEQLKQLGGQPRR